MFYGSGSCVYLDESLKYFILLFGLFLRPRGGHDTQYNDIQLNDTNECLCAQCHYNERRIFSYVTLIALRFRVFMLSVAFSYCYAACRYAERCRAECRGAT